MRLRVLLVATVVGLCALLTATSASADRARAVKVTVLSTMLAGNLGGGIGEWGFSALLEVDGQRFLLDTGQRPETVLRNAAELHVDLSDITDVIITHNHGDHTAGLVTLRRELMKRNPRALSRAHVPHGIFYPRPRRDGGDDNGLLPFKAAYESLGGVFVEHDGPFMVTPSMWFTGPVPRQYPERNWTIGSDVRVRTPTGLAEDTVPEDSSIVIDTAEGLVLVTGCGHAGVINTLTYAKKIVRDAPVVAVVGGVHLFAADDATLAWTAGKLKEFGLRYLLGAHCTGIEAVFRIRSLVGLSRQAAVVGAVGSSFTLGRGIDPLRLAS